MWGKTVMSGDKIVEILDNAPKPCGFEFKDEPKIRAVAKAQAEITGDIAHKTGYDEGLADGGVIGIKAGLKSVIDYLKEELANQNKRTAGKARLVARLNTVEATVIKTIIDALEERGKDET